MNDVVEKTASSLAIVEKKPQRLGGCVGIFFQLFDWNRRFAKKKLFSKKLLPPVRLKQASKKFGDDEKRPMLRLIADENSGGFLNANKKNGATKVDHEQRHETLSPSLVARLMGLESMPALHRKKSTKIPLSDFASDKAEKDLVEVFGYPREELNVEKGGTKNELRPQKLQKTSGSERQSMTRFGTDTLPLKNVISRSKKHHAKLPVPVKSPRNLSRKNSSKLIGAATKFLEPGSRSKCALTYSNALHLPPNLNTLMEDSDNFASLGSKGHPSCRNCGHSRDDDFSPPKHCINEQSLIFAPPSNRVGFSCQGSERSKLSRSTFYPEFEEDLHDDKLQPCVEVTPDMSSFSGQMQRIFSNQPKPMKDLPPSLRSKNPKTQCQKNFVSLNRSTSETNRMENCRFEMEKIISNGENDVVPPGRKRRPSNIPRQGESSVFMSSTVRKQTYGTPHAVSSKDFGYNVHFVNQQCRRSGLPHLHRTVDSSQEYNNVVSCMFNSPAKQKTGIHAVEKKRVQNNSGRGGITKKSALIENGANKFVKSLPLSGDAFGALLEQKSKELTSQGEDMGVNTMRKTTAMILQELISALTSEMPYLEKKSELLSGGKIPICNRNHLSYPISYTSSQANTMAAKLFVDQPLESEHLSPGSVLEVFSNESCLSSSHDDNLGYKVSNESVECCSSSEPYSFNPDSELTDSANSVTGAKTSKELVIDILDVVSETLSCINLANYGLKGSNLDHTKEVLLNSELMFQNASHSGSSVQRYSSPIKHLLIDEMETLATVLWMNFGPSLGVKDCEEVDQLTRFAFDSIIEYLELRYDKYLKSGSEVLTKLPLYMNTKVLIFEVVEEVRRSKELSVFVLDELIDLEMSHSLMKWTRFESETLETGMEISKQVLQILLDEIVMDLCYCEQKLLL